MKLFVLISILLTIVACGSSTGKAPETEPQDFVAVVNGEKITNKYLTDKIRLDLNKMEREIFQLKSLELNAIIEEKLIEQAAANVGKSPEAYVEAYITANTGGVDDEEALRQKLIEDLKSKSNVDIKLRPPKIEIDTTDSPTKGAKEAPVTIVEFSDYQCPFSNDVQPTLKKLETMLPDLIKHVFKDFPSSFHDFAQKAHEAAHCAGNQGKYWEMHDILFANQKALGIGSLKKYAKDIGLDSEKFNKCLADGIYEKKIKKDLSEGYSIGVTETPIFFINGIMLVGNRPLSEFKEIVIKEINETNREK